MGTEITVVVVHCVPCCVSIWCTLMCCAPLVLAGFAERIVHAFSASLLVVGDYHNNVLMADDFFNCRMANEEVTATVTKTKKNTNNETLKLVFNSEGCLLYVRDMNTGGYL